MEDRCASQHLTICLADSSAAERSSVPDPAQSATSTSASVAHMSQSHQPIQEQEQQQHQQLQPQQPAAVGLQCRLLIECLVISVWDDERGRLLGCSKQGNQPSELCCIYWDQLNISATRALTAGNYELTVSHNCDCQRAMVQWFCTRRLPVQGRSCDMGSAVRSR